jgi:hypothetical protein
MAERLAAAASAGLDRDTGQERWETMLDAAAYSPVRAQVTPLGLPVEPNESLLAVVKKLASRLPQIAAAFGVEAPAPRRSRGRRPPPPPPPPPLADAGPEAVKAETDPKSESEAVEPEAVEAKPEPEAVEPEAVEAKPEPEAVEPEAVEAKPEPEAVEPDPTPDP